MSRLLDHLAETAPADHLVVAAVRSLSPTAKTGRSLGQFTWIAPADIVRLPAWWERQRARGLDCEWQWIDDLVGGPERAVTHGHVHVRLPGVPMVRMVTCAERPEIAGRLDELASVLGVMVDVDVAERRPGDRRGYCPTVLHAIEFLAEFAPTVIIDAGGGLVGAWLFDRPAEPYAARDLADDVITDIGRQCRARGWLFDSPSLGGQWLKVPDCRDYFRRHLVHEMTRGRAWSFAALRALVPRYPRRPRRGFYIDNAEGTING